MMGNKQKVLPVGALEDSDLVNGLPSGVWQFISLTEMHTHTHTVYGK